MVAALQPVACGSDDSDVTAATASPDSSTSADETYLAAVRSLAEAADQRDDEIFAVLGETSPAALEFLGVLADLLPQAISESQRQISELEALNVPDGYAADHDHMLTFLRASGELLQKLLEAAEARDDLASRDLQLEIGTHDRSRLTNLSESFRGAYGNTPLRFPR